MALYKRGARTSSAQPHTPAGPLASVITALRKLAHGRKLEEVLTLAVGKTMARQILDAARRVVIRDLRGDGSGKRDSRRAIFRDDYAHHADAGHIRRLCGVFLSIVSWCGPTGRTGHRLQGHNLNTARLARYHGLSVDEVTRYVTVLRDAGVLTRWQPPAGSGCPTGPSGRAYNLYQLCGGLPEELRKQLKRYHFSWWPRDREDLTPTAEVAREQFAALQDDAALDSAVDSFLRGLKAPS